MARNNRHTELPLVAPDDSEIRWPDPQPDEVEYVEVKGSRPYRRKKPRRREAPVDHARARTTDPDTSKRVAEAITLDKLRDRHRSVLRVFADRGALTDEKLVDHYLRRYAPKQAASGIRSRRAELERLDLVEKTDLEGRTEAGNSAKVWQITTKGQAWLDATK